MKRSSVRSELNRFSCQSSSLRSAKAEFRSRILYEDPVEVHSYVDQQDYSMNTVNVTTHYDRSSVIGYSQHQDQHVYHQSFSDQDSYGVPYSLPDPGMLDDVLMPSSEFRYPNLNAITDFCASFNDCSPGVDRYPPYVTDPGVELGGEYSGHDQQLDYRDVESPVQHYSGSTVCESTFDYIPLSDLTFRDDVHHGVDVDVGFMRRDESSEHLYHDEVSYGGELDLSTNVPLPPEPVPHEDLSGASADEHIRFVHSIPKKRKLPDAVREAMNMFNPGVDDAQKLTPVESHQPAEPPLSEDLALLDDLPDLGDFEMAQLMSTMRKKKGVGFGKSSSKPVPPVAVKKEPLDLPKKRIRAYEDQTESSSMSLTPVSTPLESDVQKAEDVQETSLPHKKRISKTLISDSIDEDSASPSVEDSAGMGHLDVKNESPKGSKKQNFKCKKCNESFYSRQNLSAHQKTHVNVFTCQLCKSDFEAQNEFYEHLKSHYEGNDKDPENSILPANKVVESDESSVAPPGEFACSICEAKFVFRHRLGKHMKKMHNTKLPREARKKPKEVPSKNNCPECGKFFAKKNSLYYHLRSHNPNRNTAKKTTKHPNTESLSIKDATSVKSEVFDEISDLLPGGNEAWKNPGEPFQETNEPTCKVFLVKEDKMSFGSMRKEAQLLEDRISMQEWIQMEATYPLLRTWFNLEELQQEVSIKTEEIKEHMYSTKNLADEHAEHGEQAGLNNPPSSVSESDQELIKEEMIWRKKRMSATRRKKSQSTSGPSNSKDDAPVKKLGKSILATSYLKEQCASLQLDELNKQNCVTVNDVLKEKSCHPYDDIEAPVRLGEWPPIHVEVAIFEGMGVQNPHWEPQKIKTLTLTNSELHCPTGLQSIIFIFLTTAFNKLQPKEN
ncbi:unnamed protein product [Notodromas monacha]|uniref:C2H2-type domain-containing protein n=1 Tax=Notodromas monacha TaxID=399045 RepID=A0A7R9BSD8_9CRUS|nr:unnamed protein product [Notodromas monacha]CAG0920827.1 unnamed protein product [Notodromas monacha]